MEQVFQVTALCLVGALLAVVVRRGSPEMALLLALGAVVVVLLSLAGTVEELLSFFNELGERSGISQQLLIPLYKTVGIALVVQVGGSCAGTQGNPPWRRW